ncbi:MAG: DUF362 domain-containing protein [Candidatus Euphemobacter frigidus]|nr:DUF362 domain-containing protein [Candidatus Euphemobacter frigidus]MDP8276076.1 DUF362 domain-containing protein [Candidatus Euphemobacter frigidus]
MKTKVYFADPTAHARRSLLAKLSDLFDASGGPEIFQRGDKVAVKVHFGEEGNTSYLNPAFARLLVGKLNDLGAKPFLTDSNTLYRGKRHTTEDHLLTARRHGFTEENLGAPVVIADRFVAVEGGVAGTPPARIAKVVQDADSLLVITHVTGHVIFGYAGAIKNVSMGCASPAGKQTIHSDLKPEVVVEKCVACGTCLRYCPVGAISQDKDGKAKIDQSVCIGCGECIAVCPVGAIPPIWKGETSRLAEKSAAYARAVLRDKKGKALFLNFLIDITPDCDCCDWSDPPFVPDRGILASRDVVAIDQASVDLVRKAPLIPGSIVVKKRLRLSRKKITPAVASQYNCLPRLRDPFKSLFGIQIEPFLEEAEEAGLGSRDYRLMELS